MRERSQYRGSVTLLSLLNQTELSEILGRQVDAAVLGVLAQVAQDVRELQRDAEIVRELFGVGPVHGVLVGGAKDRQAYPPDRPGDTAAVEHQVLEALVGDAGHVHADPLDQLAERP